MAHFWLAEIPRLRGAAATVFLAHQQDVGHQVQVSSSVGAGQAGMDEFARIMPVAAMIRVSALYGEGIAEWLDWLVARRVWMAGVVG